MADDPRKPGPDDRRRRRPGDAPASAPAGDDEGGVTFSGELAGLEEIDVDLGDAVPGPLMGLQSDDGELDPLDDGVQIDPGAGLAESFDEPLGESLDEPLEGPTAAPGEPTPDAPIADLDEDSEDLDIDAMSLSEFERRYVTTESFDPEEVAFEEAEQIDAGALEQAAPEPASYDPDEDGIQDPFTPHEGDEGFPGPAPGATPHLRPPPVPMRGVGPSDPFGDLPGGDGGLANPLLAPEVPLPSPAGAEAVESPAAGGESLPREAKATDTLDFEGIAAVPDDPLRAEAHRLLQQGKLDEALTTLSTLRKMNPEDEELANRYERLMAEVIEIYFPGETPDSMPWLTVDLEDLPELIRDPLMGQLLSRMDGATPLRDLDSALPDLAPGSLYQLLSRAKGMGLIRMS